VKGPQVGGKRNRDYGILAARTDENLEFKVEREEFFHDQDSFIDERSFPRHVTSRDIVTDK
jgi:hypothetical protein